MKDTENYILKGCGCGCLSWIITNLFIFGFCFDFSWRKYQHKVWDNIDWKWWIIINAGWVVLFIVEIIWINKKSKNKSDTTNEESSSNSDNKQINKEEKDSQEVSQDKY